VVAGLDRTLTYDKLTQAALLIREGSLFIGTNPDRTYPMPGGRLVPGAGAVLAALEAATDVAPVIIGKPAPEMYQVAMERLGTLAGETLVVGDRLETDIAGAQALGCQTALVLSGVTTQAAALAWEPAPDWIEANLTELLDRL
jgi:4-nitrophenyl phosphatase